MNKNKTASGNQQMIVLGISAALATALFFWVLLGSFWFFPVLGLVGLLTVSGIFHILFWEKPSLPPQEEPHYPPLAVQWNSHQWEELPPAIQKRMTGNLFFQNEDLKSPEDPYPWN